MSWHYKKRFQSIRKRGLACILVFILAITWSTSAYASTTDNERETVRAGFFAWDGYHVEDEKGLRSGYGYDFLKMAESYSNWKVEFVGYDKTWADMLDMLDAGEIDLLTSAQKTPEWEAKYDFSNQPIGSSATVLSVRNEETQYVIGDPKSYDGMTVGCLEGSSRNDKFVEFASENHFEFKFVTYNSLSELKEALAKKEVDGVISTNLRTFNGETVLEKFDPTDYYVIVKKGNTELLNQINHAINQMNYTSPSWKEKLQSQYFSSDSEEELVLDSDELDYLKQLQNNGTKFTVVTNPDLAPYSYYDKAGNPAGIAPELFCEIADRIGLSYQFQKFDSYEEYNTFVRTGQADIDLTCFHDYGLAAYHGITITEPFMTTSLALVSRSDCKDIQKVAEVDGSAYNTTYSSGLFNDYEAITYDSNAEVIEAVTSGKADAAYQYTYMAQKSVENDIRNRLTYSILPQYQIDICMGTNEKLDYRLVSIMNEGIRALSGNYTEHLIQNNIANTSDNHGLIKMLYDYPVYAIGLVSLLFVVLITVGFALRKKKQSDRKFLEETENSKARTEFFLIISHEIRTPLNAVVSYLRMLKEEFSMEEVAEKYLNKAQSAALQLAEISDNMQDYSQITSGTVKLKNEIVKLKDVILQIDQIISVKAKEKKQTYQFEIIHFTRQFISGDSLRLTLIFQNILENAVKFSPEGARIEAKIDEEYVNQENMNLIFTCKDTGKGMSKEFTEKINTAFHQSDSAYSRTHGGLGLGLFLTQYFVKMMNGTFTVESTEGEGSTFTIVLPVKSPAIEELQEKGIKCRPIRAIVYETNEYDILMAKETLKAIGAKVDITSDKDILVKKIRSRFGGAFEYAVCIINVDLLEDYSDFVKALLSDYPTLEIVAITGEEANVPAIALHKEISHVIFKEHCYFELFNAVITDFGEAEEKKMKSSYDFIGVHALVVEDNRTNADILSKILSKHKIESTICSNGQIAVDTFEKASEDAYQIIFMDIQMPVMDGFEATRKIRSSKKKQGATIPIIAVSANAFPEDVKKSLSAGMNEHLAKPVDTKRLFEEVRKYCGKNVVEKST